MVTVPGRKIVPSPGQSSAIRDERFLKALFLCQHVMNRSFAQKRSLADAGACAKHSQPGAPRCRSSASTVLFAMMPADVNVKLRDMRSGGR